MKLDTLELWMQVHDLPNGFYPLIKALAKKVGEFVYAEPKSHDFEGNFYRVRIKINVFKPLKNAVSLVHKDERQIFKVKYERLPDWCAICGHLGHQFKEHGDGIHPKSALVFKELRAYWFRGAGPGPGQNRSTGRGGRGGRRRGAGRTSQLRGRGTESDDYSEEGTKHDTAMIEAEDNRKSCKGDMVAKNQSSKPQAQVAPAAPMKTGDTALMLLAPSVEVIPSSKQEPKRAKIVAASENATKLSLAVKFQESTSASSDLEGRRSQ